MKNCVYFKSTEEVKKINPNLIGRPLCDQIKAKEKFMDNNNNCPPDCKFYVPREKS